MATNIKIGSSIPAETTVVGFKTVTLTDAQIKALPTTGVEVIPAPGANKIVLPFFVFYEINTVAGAYTDVTDASWVLIQGAGGNYVSALLQVSQLINGAHRKFASAVVPSALAPSIGTFTDLVISQGQDDTIINAATIVKDDYGAIPDYTGGNAANTLKVTIFYTVFDV